MPTAAVLLPGSTRPGPARDDYAWDRAGPTRPGPPPLLEQSPFAHGSRARWRLHLRSSFRRLPSVFLLSARRHPRTVFARCLSKESVAPHFPRGISHSCPPPGPSLSSLVPTFLACSRQAQAMVVLRSLPPPNIDGIAYLHPAEVLRALPLPNIDGIVYLHPAEVLRALPLPNRDRASTRTKPSIPANRIRVKAMPSPSTPPFSSHRPHARHSTLLRPSPRACPAGPAGSVRHRRWEPTSPPPPPPPFYFPLGLDGCHYPMSSPSSYLKTFFNTPCFQPAAPGVPPDL